ncbi:MAG TPA: hypothetical protein VLB46_08260 [Pyrinomonadaceae bacterium]|nr:hypothetical protein [Pyrinomonadaceae bacterium]
MILCLLCLFVALSFITPLLPLASATAGSDTMPCCAGKAGHCDSGILLKKVVPPTSEPMCGLKAATMEDDGITIVAEPAQVEFPHSHSQTAELSSSQPAVESASLSSPCHMDCGACATAASRQQKRDRSIVLSNTYETAPVTTSSKYEDESLQFSSSDNWPQTVPRGPPARR